MNDWVVARERVAGVIPIEGVLYACRLQFRLELIDLLDLEEPVVNGEVAHEWRLDLRRVDIFERREAVPRNGGVDLGDEYRGEKRQRAAHAVAD